MYPYRITIRGPAVSPEGIFDVVATVFLYWLHSRLKVPGSAST